MGKLQSKFPRLKLVNDGQRRGKGQRLNQIFSLSQGDILIVLDGDVILPEKQVIGKLVEKFEYASVGLVAGKSLPIDGGGWIRRAIVRGARMWLEIREGVRRGDNVHNLSGCILALSKELYQHLVIPAGVMLDDEYIYLEAKRQGYKFRYAAEAVACYFTAGNLEDYWRQGRRSISGWENTGRIFGQWAKEYYRIPLSRKVWVAAKYWAGNPWLTGLALFLEASLRVKKMASKPMIGNWWPRINSSKNENS